MYAEQSPTRNYSELPIVSYYIGMENIFKGLYAPMISHLKTGKL